MRARFISANTRTCTNRLKAIPAPPCAALATTEMSNELPVMPDPVRFFTIEENVIDTLVVFLVASACFIYI